MIPSGLFSQIALLLIAIGIVFTYVQPTFDDIGRTQDQIAEYQAERGKVEAVNQTLAERLQKIEAVRDEDRDRLFTYMPDTIDAVLVMRDIEAMAANAGVLLDSIQDRGAVDNQPTSRARSRRTEAEAVGPFAYNFSVSMRGTYDQLKFFLEQIENNHYPLQVENLDVRAGEGNFLTSTVSLNAFSVRPSGATSDTIFADVNVTYE